MSTAAGREETGLAEGQEGSWNNLEGMWAKVGGTDSFLREDIAGENIEMRTITPATKTTKSPNHFRPEQRLALW